MPMLPVHLAVFCQSSPESGGGFQQTINAAKLVGRLPAHICRPFFFTHKHQIAGSLKKYGLDVICIPRYTLVRLELLARNVLYFPVIKNFFHKFRFDNGLERFFNKYGIDLVYFTSPSTLALFLEKTNFITTVWDLCHRDHPEFPEVNSYRIFEIREKLYRASLPKAVAVVADSELGKNNISKRYLVDEKRIHVIPFSSGAGSRITDEQYASKFIDIKQKYKISGDYVFYPAQFWAHKNHVYILHGLKLLEEKHGIRLGAIFTGGDAGKNKQYVQQRALSIGIADRIVFTGFVPDDEMPYLYKQSVALVMPTYFGPTNIPPLEAFQLGVPVLYSDLPGLKEQVGDAALLLTLDDPNSLADNLFKLMTDSRLKEALVSRGKQKVLDVNDDHQVEILTKIVENFQIKRVCWS